MPKLHFEPSKISGDTEIADIKYRYGLGKIISIRVERPIDPGFRQENEGTGVTILCPGWVELGKSLSPLRRTMAQLGHTAATIHHPQPRWYRPDQAIFTARSDRIQGIQEVHRFLGEVLVNPVDISTLGHSMGGSDQTRAFAEYPIAPRVMSYAGSAGMNPEATFTSVARGIIAELTTNEIPRKINKQEEHAENEAFWGVIRYALQNPNSAFAQGVDAAKHYTGRHIGDLALRGVVLVDMTAELDKVFPPLEEEEYKSKLPFDVRRHLSGVNATHNFTTYMPEEVSIIHLDAIARSNDLLADRILREQEAINRELLGG